MNRFKFRVCLKLATQSILLHSNNANFDDKEIRLSGKDFNQQIESYNLTSEDYKILWETYAYEEEVDYYPDILVKFDDIEQCTGLKDKHGKLIYENDILFVEVFDWKNKEKLGAGKIKTYWTVEYKDYANNSCFMVFGRNRRFHKPLTRLAIFNSEAVIIGNIHENSELLGGM